MDAENNSSRSDDVVLPDGEPIISRAKDYSFSSMCDFPENISNLPMWSCVLKKFSECLCLFVTDAEMNCEEYLIITFIIFHHHEIINYRSFYKQLFPEHGKICPSFMNIEKYEKGKVTTMKIIVLKSCSILDFHS